ncbi:unnamed protein product [Arabidopsis thaliana]|uniref:(thale cress) hypothetical protein n=1 Tax=Arabidopsis thaliana TaxID=3702 RepID=A0A7G2E7N7_ARATH|nr:unnamed protein product [Arabidopsis thaliana]
MTSSFEKNPKLATKKKRNSLFLGRENKRRRRESKKIHIPHKIIEGIIMKLPVKSLIRFQYVSKHLRTLITSKDFEGRHMSHQKTQAPKLLFVCDDLVNHADNTLLIKTMALVLETTSASVENKECLKFQESKGFLDISESWRYKLVWLYNKYPDSTSLSKKKVRCEVLDLEEKKWRFVNTTPLDHHHILFDQRPVFANGSLYWLTGDEQGDPTNGNKTHSFRYSHRDVSSHPNTAFYYT